MRRIAVIAIDLAIIYGSIILSFLLLKSEYLLDYSYNIGAFYIVAPFIIPIYIMVGYIFGMMTLQRRSIPEIIYTITIVSIGLTISITAVIFFLREGAHSYPRSIIILGALIYTILLILWRIIVQKIYIKVHGKRKAIVIGSINENLANILRDKYSKLYEVKMLKYDQDIQNIKESIQDYSEIFISDTVPESVREGIVLANNDKPNINIYYIPKITDIPIINSKLFPFDDMPTHLIRKMHLNEEELFMKRLIDVCISTTVLIITLPIMLIVSLLVKMDGGTIFYTQERLTKDRKPFLIYKFRSMKVDAEMSSGPALAQKNDSRITRIGKLLRNTRLDELPQFYNILKGEMSIVGPRPERPFFVEKIENEIPEFRYRLNVKAGLTGLAQVMGRYNTDFKQKLHYDLHYISNFSILKDIIIMIQTVKIIFWKDAVKGVDKKW